MNKQDRIKTLEEKLQELRRRWAKGSLAMRRLIEEEANTTKREISLLEKVIRRQEGRKQPQNPPLLPLDKTE